MMCNIYDLFKDKYLYMGNNTFLMQLPVFGFILSKYIKQNTLLLSIFLVQHT